jgi:Skp family chaperone for outer membrane proteins
MKGFALFAALAFILSAAPARAQAPAQPAAPRPAPATAAPKPATPAPAQAPAVQPPVVQPPAPFPQGAKFAYVNLPALFQLSRDGKAAAARIQKATEDKQKTIETKAKALQSNQQKLETGGSVMTEAARTALQKEVERQQREGERLEQDAQQELNELQQEVQGEFQKKLFPVLAALAQEKGLLMLFSAGDAGLIWAEPGLDLTMEAAKRLDGPAGAAAPAEVKPQATPK